MVAVFLGCTVEHQQFNRLHDAETQRTQLPASSYVHFSYHSPRKDHLGRGDTRSISTIRLRCSLLQEENGLWNAPLRTAFWSHAPREAHGPWVYLYPAAPAYAAASCKQRRRGFRPISARSSAPPPYPIPATADPLLNARVLLWRIERFSKVNANAMKAWFADCTSRDCRVAFGSSQW